MKVTCICGGKMVKRMRAKTDRYVKYRYACTSCPYVLRVMHEPRIFKGTFYQLRCKKTGVGDSSNDYHAIADGRLTHIYGDDVFMDGIDICQVTGKLNPKRAMVWFAKAQKLKAFL